MGQKQWALKPAKRPPTPARDTRSFKQILEDAYRDFDMKIAKLFAKDKTMNVRKAVQVTGHTYDDIRGACKRLGLRK